MAAMDHLSPYQFKTFTDYPERNQIRAYHGDTGEEVGHFHWANEPHVSAAGMPRQTGEITHVGVDKGHQRQGLARHMYSMAQQVGPPPLHSRDLDPDGVKFAHGVGGAWVAQ